MPKHVKKNKKTKVRVMGYDTYVKFARYRNSRIAIELICVDGEPYTTATVNLPHDELGENCVFIKTYSENEGVLAALEKAGVVKATGRVVESGFVSIPEAQLLPPYDEIARKVKA